jgi:hypothetical protein
MAMNNLACCGVFFGRGLLGRLRPGAAGEAQRDQDQERPQEFRFHLLSHLVRSSGVA